MTDDENAIKLEGIVRSGKASLGIKPCEGEQIDNQENAGRMVRASVTAAASVVFN